MGKNKNKHKKLDKKIASFKMDVDSIPYETKRSMNKKFKKALDDIEEYRIQLYEADKRQRRKERKKINKHESEFYTDMEGLKCRKRMAKEWEDSGFLDRLINLLQQIAPVVAILAKVVGFLIISFLSIDAIKASINPKTLRKISNVYDIAMSI